MHQWLQEREREREIEIEIEREQLLLDGNTCFCSEVDEES
jgi:hypothetical protein